MNIAEGFTFYKAIIFKFNDTNIHFSNKTVNYKIMENFNSVLVFSIDNSSHPIQDSIY